MITDINRKNIISKLDKTKLQSHWLNYFEYENNIKLYNLTKNELNSEIEIAKKMDSPYIDSEIVISKILTKFGQKHSFHRQFREEHPNSDSGKVLGMQLYNLILNDCDIWIYLEKKPRNHKFSHATYFK